MRKKHIPKIKFYFLMNKKSGFVCSTVSDRRQTVYVAFPKDILADENGAKLHSVGRLDAGLVLPPEKKAGEQKSGGAKIDWLNENECKITLTEGKFHEVKRIFRALGNEVVFLRRIKMAGLVLDESLKPGEYRTLNESEIEALYAMLEKARL